MIKQLTLYNFKPNLNIQSNLGEVFILKTCQRTIVLGFDQSIIKYSANNTECCDKFKGENAYTFLLETICGLRSEVIAEYEIVSQFKQAFNEYLKLPSKSSLIIQLFERLFKDSKFIRTHALKGIGQLSYAGITRKLIYDQNPNAEVLILGSGTLSEDLIKLLKKKHTLHLSARNNHRVQELATKHQINVLPWGNIKELINFEYIANTIGNNEILFDEHFFEPWAYAHTGPKLFIDLGSPSVIRTSMDKNQGVVRLQDIFKKSASLNVEKMKKVNDAYELVGQLTKKSFESLLTRMSDYKIKDPDIYEKML